MKLLSSDRDNNRILSFSIILFLHVCFSNSPFNQLSHLLIPSGRSSFELWHNSHILI